MLESVFTFLQIILLSLKGFCFPAIFFCFPSNIFYCLPSNIYFFAFLQIFFIAYLQIYIFFAFLQIFLLSFKYIYFCFPSPSRHATYNERLLYVRNWSVRSNKKRTSFRRLLDVLKIIFIFHLNLFQLQFIFMMKIVICLLSEKHFNFMI